MNKTDASEVRGKIPVRINKAIAVFACVIVTLVVVDSLRNNAPTPVLGGAPSGVMAMAEVADQAMMSKMAPPSVAMPAAPSMPGEVQYSRHIAITHSITLRPSGSPKDTLKAIVASCAAGCEVLRSSANDHVASLSLRIEPGKATALEQIINSLGRVSDHEQTATDKTIEVADADARAKNLNVYRDKLREMVGSAPNTETLLTLNREMLNVQSQLDSAEMIRKSLRNETEKVQYSLTIGSYEVQPAQNAWDKLIDSLKQSGTNFLASVASLVTTAAYLAPYIILAAFASLGYASWSRRRKATPGTQAPRSE